MEKETPKIPLTQRIARWGFLPILFVSIAALVSWQIAVNIFNVEPFRAAIFAVVSVALTIIFAIGGLNEIAQKASNKEIDLESLIDSAQGTTLEERRNNAREELRKTQDELLEKQRIKNFLEFWTKVVIVLTYLAVYVSVMYTVYGVYPESAFVVPWWVVAIFWVVAFRFMPKTIVVFTLLFITGMVAVIAVMGPLIILKILPYTVMLPMFMVMNFLMVYGPLVWIGAFLQTQYLRPGEGDWGTTLDDVRGQDDAKRQILEILSPLLSGEEDLFVRFKGVIMTGPPGVGKSLLAKAFATRMKAAAILTTGSAFISTFIGVPIIVLLYIKSVANSMGKEFKWCLVYIEEADQLLTRRAGVQDGSHQNKFSIANAMEYTANSVAGDVFHESQESLEKIWMQKYPERYHPQVHPQMMPGMGMGMGANMGGLSLYLDWLDGVPAAPLGERVWRETVNWILDITLIPVMVEFKGKTIRLRMDRAKPDKNRVIHLASTNLPDQIDPAVIRPGRLARVDLRLPGIEERADIAALYFGKVAEKNLLAPELRTKINDFAASSIGLSPAEIMDAVYGALSMRKLHIQKLKKLAKQVEQNEHLKESDERFWGKYKNEIGQPDWDRRWATWSSLSQSLQTVRYGLEKPQHTTSKHRNGTAYHEAGHLIALNAFSWEYEKPFIFSILPRGEFLGLVGYISIEEMDPKPQPYWEAALRVGIASIVIERLFLKDSQPGVIQDLETATRIASLMVGKFGMPARWSDKQSKAKYIEIGESLISIPEHTPTGMSGSGIIGSKAGAVSLLLGQAFVDDFRLLSKNRDLVPIVTEKVLKDDEVVGSELDTLWNNIHQNIKLLGRSDKEWPKNLLVGPNPFYQQAEV